MRHHRPADTDDEAETPSRTVRRRRGWIIGASAALAVAIAGGCVWVSVPHGAPAPRSTGPTPATVVAERKDVPVRVVARGTIEHPTVGTLTTPLAGTVTTAPTAGAVLTPGSTLMKVDDQPVTVLRGALPAWRAFAPGMPDGADVRQLEQALRDAGFGPGWVDDHFTDVTESAVKRWQRSVDADPTGRVPLGAVVFLDADARVGTALVARGDLLTAGAKVVTLARNDRVVTATMTPTDAARVRPDLVATVTMPDGSTAKGTVRSVGAPAPASTDDEGATDPDGEDPSKVEVVIGLDATDGPDDVEVRVQIEAPGIAGSVVVPVEAVLATGSDAYAVQVLRAGRVRSQPVELGTTADGSVAITKGLTGGEHVVVPR